MKVWVLREDATNVDHEDILHDVFETKYQAMCSAMDQSQCWKDGWDEGINFFVRESTFFELSWGGTLLELHEEDVKEPLVTWKIYEMETVR